MERRKTTIDDFRYLRLGYGVYRVIYTSPATGDMWVEIIHDTELTDATLHTEAEFIKQKDIERLKKRCKEGRKFSKDMKLRDLFKY